MSPAVRIGSGIAVASRGVVLGDAIRVPVVAGGGVGSTPFVTDTFTDTSGLAITSHTPELGGPWIKHASAGASANPVISNANRYRGISNTGFYYYYATAIPPQNEYDVSAVLHCVTDVAAQYMGVAGRMDTASIDQYIGYYVKASGAWRLSKHVAGVETILDSEVATLAAATSYAIKLEIRDAMKKLFVGGVEVCSSADNTITRVGRVGIQNGGANVGDTFGYHLDTFSAVG